MKRTGVRLYWLILTLLLPCVLVAALGVAISIQQRFAANIIQSFDEKLVGTVSLIGTFLDGETHRTLYPRRKVTALATAPASGQLYGWDAATGEFLRIFPDGAGEALAQLPLGNVQDLAVANETEAVFLLSEPASLYHYKMEQGVGAFHPLLSNPTFTHILTGPDDQLYLWDGEQMWRWEAPAPPTRFETPLDGKSLSTLLWSNQAQAWLAQENEQETLTWIRATDGRMTPSAIRVTDLTGDLALGPEQLWMAAGSLGFVDATTGEVSLELNTTHYYPAYNPAYLQEVETFKRIRRATGLSYLYTQYLVDETSLFYIIDGSEEDEFTTLGYADSLPADSYLPLKTGELTNTPVVRPIEEWENWGFLKSGFGPIRMDDGSSEGLIGADLKVDIIEERTRQADFASILTAVFGIALALSFTVLATRRLTQPINDLKNHLVRIAGGELQHAFSPTPVQELNRVGLACAMMAKELQRVQNAQTAQRQVYQTTIRQQRFVETNLEGLKHRLQSPDKRLQASSESGASCLDHHVSQDWHLVWFIQPQPDASEASRLALARQLAQWQALLSHTPGESLSAWQHLDQAVGWSAEVSLFIWQAGQKQGWYRLAPGVTRSDAEPKQTTERQSWRLKLNPVPFEADALSVEGAWVPFDASHLTLSVP